MPDLTLKEAGAELGLSDTTLRVQIHNGALKATKVGPVWTVTRRELERYRARHQRRCDVTHPELGRCREPAGHDASSAESPHRY